jgi:DNA-directed RNA polymerase specialized sigma24 family protein
MQLTREELTAFLSERKSRIAALAAPTDVEVALVELDERIGKQLPVVPDTKSLESLVNIAATDIALRPLYAGYCSDHADDEMFRKLLDWREGFLEAEVLKTIRSHVSSREAVEAVMANVMVALWDSRKTFDPRKGWFVPWARAIALNKARGHRPFNWREVSIETSQQRPLDLPASGPSPEDAAVAGERSADSDGPPPKSFVEILLMVQEFEPHEAIAFLFNRYLGVKPEQIALRIRESSLPDALAEVTKIVRALHPEIAGIDTLLTPLASRVNGRAEKFGQFVPSDSTIEKEIGRWAARIHRSVRGTILQMGKRFLRLVCDLSAAAHEIVAFLWIRLSIALP